MRRFPPDYSSHPCDSPFRSCAMRMIKFVPDEFVGHSATSPINIFFLQLFDNTSFHKRGGSRNLTPSILPFALRVVLCTINSWIPAYAGMTKSGKTTHKFSLRAIFYFNYSKLQLRLIM